MFWCVKFIYYNGLQTTVTNETYNDDEITFLQLKKNIINKKNSHKFIYNGCEIIDSIKIKEYNNECINILKTKKVYNKIVGLTKQIPSIDLNNKNIIKIINTYKDIYVALTSDGNVISWCYYDEYQYTTGNLNKCYNNVKDYLFDIIDIHNTEYAFAALKSDNTVVTWGCALHGGDSSEVELINVEKIFSNKKSFAALKSDNTIVTWGNCLCPYNTDYYENIINTNIIINVETIFNTDNAFAALTYDKKIITWGHSIYGGDSSLIKNKLVNIKMIYSTNSAFAALNYDGEVYSWGSCNTHNIFQEELFNVNTITCTDDIFMILKNDNTIVIWGSPAGLVSYDIQDNIDSKLVVPPNVGAVLQVFSYYCKFIVLCEKGFLFEIDTLKCYDETNANTLKCDLITNAHTLKCHLINDETNVKAMYKSGYSFAALRNDGTVYTWGSSENGGDSSYVQKHLTNIKYIVSTSHSFAAVKNNDDVVVWGCNHGDTILNDIYTNIENVFCTSCTLFLVNEF
jgi:hypothetical protein